MSDFPLVMSMTQFGNYRRCRKLFEYSALRSLSPVKTSEPVELGSEAHSLLAYAAEHGGTLPFDWTGSMEMYNVVKEYINRKGLPPVLNIKSVERGFYAEIAPNVFIRGTFDIMFQEQPWLVVQDYKTFDRAPSLDADNKQQGKEYVLIAATALKTPVQNIIFRWEYIRRELGRLLQDPKDKSSKRFVEWTDDERYMRHDMIVSPQEEEILRKELYDCALDMQETIRNQRFYRTRLDGHSPFTCGSCFYRDICNADFHQGMLTDGDLEALTTPTDPSERVDALTILEDPRVRWYIGQGVKAADAVHEVYGITGVHKVGMKALDLGGKLGADGLIHVETSI